jgi:hypothetical protein
MNWKLALAVVVVVAALAFAGVRARRLFREESPSWMNYQQLTSPALGRHSLEHYRDFQREVTSAAEFLGIPVGSLQLFEVLSDGATVRHWQPQAFSNPGFNSLSQFEVNRWLTDDRLVGYYTTNGRPLQFSLKQHPARSNTVFCTVLAPQPVAPGESLLTLRVERRPDRLVPSVKGEYRLSLPRPFRNTNTIHAVGVVLAANLRLVRAVPEEGAYIRERKGTLVAWLNTRLPAQSSAPAVVFRED